MKYAQVKSIMTKNLITVTPFDTLQTVCELLEKHNIHHLLVLEGGQLSGIISSTDLERAKHGKSLFISKNEEGFQQALLDSIMVGSVMTEKAAFIQDTDTVYDAYLQFKNNAYRCLPVKDADNKLVGLVTPIDLLDHVFNQ